jgi:acid phosphatase (class A)
MKATRLRRTLSFFLLFSLLLPYLNAPGIYPAIALRSYYIDPSQADLIRVLPPPPRLGSIESKADLQAVAIAGQHRTKREVSEALADDKESVFRFADVMGPGFNSGNLPYATGFFQRLSSDAEGAVSIAKLHFKRPRPFALDRGIKPLLSETWSSSYPSGHAAFGYLNAIVLSCIVPEKIDVIYDRARQYAHNRVILGIHYPTDTQAGLISASVIANVLLHQPAFLADLARARSEVRAAIGLKP